MATYHRGSVRCACSLFRSVVSGRRWRGCVQCSRSASDGRSRAISGYFGEVYQIGSSGANLHRVPDRSASERPRPAGSLSAWSLRSSPGALPRIARGSTPRITCTGQGCSAHSGGQSSRIHASRAGVVTRELSRSSDCRDQLLPPGFRLPIWPHRCVAGFHDGDGQRLPSACRHDVELPHTATG